MPSKKSLQLRALRLVREAAVKSYKYLNDEEKRLRKLSGTNNTQRRSMSLQESSEAYHPQYNNGAEGSINYHSPSLAENVLSNNSGAVGNGEQPNPSNLSYRVGQDGNNCPYNPAEPEYLSKFPVGFKGCFMCGRSDLWKRGDFPLGNVNDKTIFEVFFKEFHIHCPNNARSKTCQVSYHHIYSTRYLCHTPFGA